jgi:hypothetical protein
MTGWTIVMTAIAFAIGAAGAKWLLGLGGWTTVGVGSLSAAVVFGALSLAAVAARTGGASFAAFWTIRKVAFYNCAVGLALILLGAALGSVAGPRRLTAVAIISAASGLVMIGISLIEYFRVRRRTNRG